MNSNLIILAITGSSRNYLRPRLYQFKCIISIPMKSSTERKRKPKSNDKREGRINSCPKPRNPKSTRKTLWIRERVYTGEG